MARHSKTTAAIEPGAITRRSVLAATAGTFALPALTKAGGTAKPAILGGGRIRTEPFPAWPIVDNTETKALVEVLESRKWYRGWGKKVSQFEEAYARFTGAKFCLATANGTSALYTALNALGVEPGDEVVVPPYTFIATVNVVLRQFALPRFVDTDLETFQIDATKIESAISDRTKAILPVHLGGSPCDLDAILPIGAKHRIPVLEDACQAHLAEWRSRKVGTYGNAGCFSFQASKNLNSGEGGAILTNNEEFWNRCYTFHNNGNGPQPGTTGFAYSGTGFNLRMTEFQAALLVAQMTRVEAQAKIRTENALYLTSLLREIPGIVPARMYGGASRNAYHLYMFRYQKDHFSTLSRERFLKALAAEGIPVSAGYKPLNREPFLRDALKSKAYRALYPSNLLARWEEHNHCPNNDRLCEEAVWLSQTMLLGTRTDMEQIAEAVRKLQSNAAELART